VQCAFRLVGKHIGPTIIFPSPQLTIS